MTLTRWHYWFLSFLTLASLIALQAGYDQRANSFTQTTRTAILKNDQPLLPSVPTLRLLSLNNEPLLADVLWLQTIQYFGSGSPYGMYPALGPMTDTITQLDPQFSYPYEFGMLVLPFMGRAEQAEKLGLRAQQYLPNNGLLTYYLATVYQLNIRDYKKAAQYYALASTQPGSPAAASQLAAVAQSQVHNSLEDREAAKIFWRTAIVNARNDDERIRASRWLAHIEIVQSLEIAAQQYKNQQGHFPGSLQDLVDTHFISAIPQSPIHRKLILQSDGTINFDELEDGI
jgi:tetratricopeptide (TPR) repeat protein